MERDIRHTWFYPHAPEVVWDFLTKPELLALWLMENDIQPVVGHKFRFWTKPRINFGFDGTVYCEVKEVDAPRRLRYSWRGGMGENVSLDSMVIWTLTPKDGGTELLLEHTGFRGVRNFFVYLIMNKGWLKISKRLGVRMNTYRHEPARP